jgi:hypothetical protein
LIQLQEKKMDDEIEGHENEVNEKWNIILSIQKNH